MDDELKIIIKASLDESTEISLNKQLKSLRLDDLPLNIRLNLGINNSVSEAQKVATKINETLSKNINKNLDLPKINLLKDLDKSLKNSVKIPFQVDIKNPDELKDEMERIVSDFTNSKGKLVDYRVKTHFDFDEKENKQIELLSGATLKYKNELDEVITKELKWQKIGAEISKSGEQQEIMGFSEAYSSYSQNVEKATEKQEKLKVSTEKLANKLSEYKKSFENLQIKADKSGVSLNTDNISGFKKAIDNKDLEKSRHLLSMLQKEWQGLNATMVKDTPNTALENMNKYISKMPFSIESIELKLENLSSPSKDIQDKVIGLKEQLKSVYKSGTNEEKLFNYGKLKQAIIEVNAELSNQIKIERKINQDKNLVYDKKPSQIAWQLG